MKKRCSAEKEQKLLRRRNEIALVVLSMTKRFVTASGSSSILKIYFIGPELRRLVQ